MDVLFIIDQISFDTYAWIVHMIRHVLIEDRQPSAIYLITSTSPLHLEGVHIVSPNIFPFTLRQISELTKQQKLSQQYKQQLMMFYAAQILPISDYYLVMTAPLADVKLSFFVNDIPIMLTTHGCYRPHFEHMRKLLSNVEKRIYESCIAPYMIFNRNIVLQIMDEVSTKMPFWYEWCNAVDKYSSVVSSNPFEFYGNYVACRYPNNVHVRPFVIKTYPSDSASVDVLSAPACVSLGRIVHDKPSSYDYTYMVLLRNIRSSIQNASVTWVDIECGQWYGSIFWNDTIDKYVGVDADPSIIEKNKKIAKPSMTFVCTDLPMIDSPCKIAILRNVLSYMSYVHIKAMLKLLSGYTCVIITDSISANAINKDVATSTEHRTILVDQHPFSIPAREVLRVTRADVVTRTLVWYPLSLYSVV